MRLPAARFTGSLRPEYLAKIQPIDPEGVSVETAPPLLRRVWGAKTGAMTLGSRIFVSPSILEEGGPALTSLLLHELVHARQWNEKGAIRFLLSYARQYLVARLAGASHRDAYLAIDLEVEARSIAGQYG